MLDKKSDYRFVPEGVMKHIVINGNPFPLRGMLAITGEDEAFLKEAVTERVALANQNGYSILPSQVREIIFKVNPTLDEMAYNGLTYRTTDDIVYGSISSLIRYFYDKNIIDNLLTTAEPIVVYSHSCDNTTPRDDDATQKITAFEIIYRDRVEEAQQLYHDTVEGNTVKGIEGIKPEIERRKEERRSQASAERDPVYESHSEALEQLERNYLAAKETIETAYVNECARIEGLDISENEKTFLRFQALQKRDGDIYSTNADYNKKRKDENIQFNRDIASIENSLDEDIIILDNEKSERITEAAQNEVATIRNVRQTIISAINNYVYSIHILSFGENVLEKYSQALEDYNNTVSASQLKSCVESFYRKSFIFNSRSASGLYRIFADLERMIVTKYTPLNNELVRDTHTIEVIGSHYHQTDTCYENGSDVRYNQLYYRIIYPEYTYSETHSSSKFSIFAENSKTLDSLDYILADIEIVRDESWSKDISSEIAAAKSEIVNFVNAAGEAAGAGEHSFLSYYEWNGDRIYFEDSATRPQWVKSCDLKVEEYNARYDHGGDLDKPVGYKHEKYIQRIKFTRTRFEAGDWCTYYDSIVNTRDTALKALDAEYAPYYANALAEYHQELRDLEDTYKNKLDTIDKKYEGLLAAKAKEIYAPLLEEATQVNTENEQHFNPLDRLESLGVFEKKISKAKGDLIDYEILLSPQKEQERTLAHQEYEAACQVAKDEYEDETKPAIDSRYNAEKETIISTYNQSMTEFNDDYRDFIENPANIDEPRFRNFHRVRFSASVPTPGEDTIPSQATNWAGMVEVVGIKNCFFVWKPRSLTGVDYSPYYLELASPENQE